MSANTTEAMVQLLVGGAGFGVLPRYHVHDEGPDHAKRFYATVMLGGVPHGSGEGGSKKQAEQAAARAAWRWLSLQGTEGADGPKGTDEADTSEAPGRLGAEGAPGEGPPSDGTRAGSAMGGTNAGAT